MPPKTNVGPLIEAARSIDQKIKNVTLSDIYQANYTFTVEYWDSKNNLSAEDVKPLRKQLIALVEKEFQAKLVGKVQ